MRRQEAALRQKNEADNKKSGDQFTGQTKLQFLVMLEKAESPKSVTQKDRNLGRDERYAHVDDQRAFPPMLIVLLSFD